MKIARWTNQYHQQQIKSEKGDALKNSHILKWNVCTIDDIYNYILLQIYFGTIKSPDIKFCWSKNIYLNQKYVVNKMTSDRYYQISKNIRWSSNSTNKELKEEKYKDFLFNSVSNSNKLYVSSNQKTIDESMVKFEGRAKNVIYMRDKPINWGFKMYVICDSINGFCLNIIPHIGDIKFVVKKMVVENFF